MQSTPACFVLSICYQVRLLFLILLYLPAAFAQSSTVRMVDVYLRHGKADYLDLSDKKVFDVYKPVKNLESFVIGYKGWSLVGDYVYNPSFYYSINPDYLAGKRRTVRFRTISKYPDLVKRYQSIRPVSVNFSFSLKVIFDGTRNDWLVFKVSNNDLVYFGSRSSRNYQSPTSPLKWTNAVEFTKGGPAYSDEVVEKKLKEVFRSLQSFEHSSGNDIVQIDVKWDEDAIDAIAELYDKYEKENKKIDNELKDLKESDKKVDPALAYNKDDEMALPVEAEPKSAEVFNEKGIIGLKAKGKVVFSSDQYSSGSPIDEAKNLFSFRTKSGEYHLLNTKGKLLTIEGKSTFARIEKGKRAGTYLLYALQVKNFYETKRAYRDDPTQTEDIFATEEQFAAMKEKDYVPPKGGSSSSSSSGGRVLEYSFATTYRYSRYIVFTIDRKLNTLSTETVYSAYLIN